MKKKGLVFTVVLSLWAVRSLFQPGFFPVHDDTQVARVYEMAVALRAGQLPVRWVPDLGYGFGYPLFNFYAPLPYYFGGLLNIVGFDALWATKLMMIAGVLFAGVAMYLLSREFFGQWGGLVSAVFYVYAPYRAVNLYVRGAIGELWAMAFLPLVFLGLWKIYRFTGFRAGKLNQEAKTGQSFALVIFSLSLAGVILSHNLTVLMLIPFLGLVFLVALFFSKNKKLFTFHFSLFTLLGLSLAAFYWLPALVEMGHTRVSEMIATGTSWQEHFVYLDQFWTSPAGRWGYGGSAPGRLDGMSFMLGKLHLIFAAFSVIWILRKPWKLWTPRISWKLWTPRKLWTLRIPWIPRKLWMLNSTLQKSSILTHDRVSKWKIYFGFSYRGFAIGVALAGLLLSVFLTTEWSRSIWESVKPMAYLQFPWRFLVFAALFVSFIPGALGRVVKRYARVGKAVLLGIMMTTIAFNGRYFRPQFIKEVGVEELTSEEALKWTASKISDEYLPAGFVIPQNKSEIARERFEIIGGTGKVEKTVMKPTLYRIKLTGDSPFDLKVNIASFLGWEYFLDGVKTLPQKTEGPPLFEIPPGGHLFEARFANTRIRTLANVFTLGALIILAFLGRVTIKPFRKK